MIRVGWVKNLFFSAVFVLLVIPSSASANLLLNPSFETGDLSNWTVDWNSQNLIASNTNPQSGIYHARNTWDGGMYQDVYATAGQQYKLTGWAFIPSGTGGSNWGSFIGLRFLDSIGGAVGDYQIDMEGLPRNQHNMADTGYVTAPATTVTARVRFGTWADDPWQPVNPTDFDNFDLAPIPEPASLLMLGFGLFGLGFFGKKKT